MMHMTFYWGRDVTVLFDFWRTSTWTDYSLTLLACLAFSLFYQYLEALRIRFNSLPLRKSLPAAAAPLLSPDNKKVLGPWGRSLGAVIFGVNSALGYMLMLAIMSFNGGVFVAVVVGLAVGCFLFRSSGDDAIVVADNPCACA